jgi:RNA polymerase sigma-70 factor (ECF subfamily)
MLESQRNRRIHVGTLVEAGAGAGEIASSSWCETDRAPLDDQELVRRARSGDADAFEDLVRRHTGSIYRLLVRLLRDPTAAEDVTQETFIGAWKSLPRFRGDAKFSTWLYRIAVNKGNTFLSREAQRRTVPLDENVDRLPDLGAAPSEEVEDREFQAELERWIGELPPSYRAAVVLRDVDGLTNEEAASVLDIGVRNLKSRLHRGRMILRHHLEELAASEARARPAQPRAAVMLETRTLHG